jgi:hypothetical protein
VLSHKIIDASLHRSRIPLQNVLENYQIQQSAYMTTPDDAPRRRRSGEWLMAVGHDHLGIRDTPLLSSSTTTVSKRCEFAKHPPGSLVHEYHRGQRDTNEVRRPRTWMCLFDSMMLALAEYDTGAISECGHVTHVSPVRKPISPSSAIVCCS